MRLRLKGVLGVSRQSPVLGDVLGSWGCCNQGPQSGGVVKAIGTCPPTVLEARSVKSRCCQGWFLPEGLGRICSMPLFQLLEATSHPRRPRTCRCITPISASVFIWPSPLCVFSLSLPLSGHLSLHLGFPLNQDDLISRSLITSERPLFQTSSQSQLPGGHIFRRVTIQSV